MDFSGPEPADFANVTALNRAFLLRLRSPALGRNLRAGIPVALRSTTEGLTDVHMQRLSACPFLLFSLRERDANFWQDVVSAEPAADLFAGNGDAHREISVAAMSFVWQLARRNPYAVRLITGATPTWCDRIADCTLLDLLQRVAGCCDFLQPRFAGNDACWRKLLGPGLSTGRQARESAFLACLQTLLTDEPAGGMRRMRPAACDRPVPVMTRPDRRRQS